MAEPGQRTGTRWGRSTVALVAGLLAAGGLGAAMATGALATTMVAQGADAQLATSSLYGTDFGIVSTTAGYQPIGGGGTATQNMLRLAFANGRINQLCIAEQESLGGIGYTLMITAGNGNQWDIYADHILLDLSDAKGVLDLDGWGTTSPEAQVGVDAASVAVAGVPAGDLNGGTGGWGIKAGIAKLGPITATVRQMNIEGVLTAPKLHIQVLAANSACPAPVAPIGVPS